MARRARKNLRVPLDRAKLVERLGVLPGDLLHGVERGIAAALDLGDHGT